METGVALKRIATRNFCVINLFGINNQTVKQPLLSLLERR